MPEPGGGRPARARRVVLTGSAEFLAWAVLVAPDRPAQLTPGVLLRIPLEGLVLVAGALLLPPREGRAVGTAAGALLGVLAVVRLLDLGFREALYRPFVPVADWRLLGPAVATFRDSVGTGVAVAAVVGAVLLAVALPVLLALVVRRVGRVAAGHRRAATRVLGALGAVWLVAAVAGTQLVAGEPVASTSAARLAVDQVGAARENLRDLPVFRAQLAAPDPYRAVPAADLLTGLHGKDVVLAFVESYGRVAVQGAPFSAAVRQGLDAGTRQLRAAGFSARSAFLTSPTFGGVSWLAHATLQSGLWVDRQQRHDQLLAGDRLTLTAAFSRAGWRTVLDVPSNGSHWREGRAFYRFDRDYYRDDVGYAGPRFSYASMPDQYTLAALEQREFAPGHPPVMAEVDLVSSHTPWTPQPRLVGWNRVGDGSVFDPMPAEGPTPAEVAGDRTRIGALYGQSIRYSLQALVSWVTTFHARDDDLVLVLLGDHQPAAVVSGPHASHDVPVTVVACDPAVLQRIAPWGWDAGLRPAPDAPVWRMDAFRDRFLTAFGEREGP